ncbi:hypothetical protein [Priestia aryabhattai]|nr:hypothetical protein [Priestia aryabhattai]MBE5098037.1 hypothetical protein [Priestia aryabhattai]
MVMEKALGFYMLGVVPMVYSFYEMEETFDVVQENKNKGQARLHNLMT